MVVSVPVAAFRITIDGVALGGEIAGDGEPVVLLYAESPDRRMWHDAFGSSAERHLTVRDDLRGCGDSGPGATHADGPFARHTDLLAVLDHLKIERVALVGAPLSAIPSCRTPSRPASSWPGRFPPPRSTGFRPPLTCPPSAGPLPGRAPRLPERSADA